MKRIGIDRRAREEQCDRDAAIKTVPSRDAEEAEVPGLQGFVGYFSTQACGPLEFQRTALGNSPVDKVCFTNPRASEISSHKDFLHAPCRCRSLSIDNESYCHVCSCLALVHKAVHSESPGPPSEIPCNAVEFTFRWYRYLITFGSRPCPILESKRIARTEQR